MVFGSLGCLGRPKSNKTVIPCFAICVSLTKRAHRYALEETNVRPVLRHSRSDRCPVTTTEQRDPRLRLGDGRAGADGRTSLPGADPRREGAQSAPDTTTSKPHTHLPAPRLPEQLQPETAPITSANQATTQTQL